MLTVSKSGMNATKSMLIEIDEELDRALRQFIENTGSIVTPAEAIQAALRDWAILHGYLKESPEPDMPSLESLNI